MALSYFEFHEFRTQRSVSVDVVEWPEIVVTESVADEDTLLQLELLRNPQDILGRWYDPEETR